MTPAPYIHFAMTTAVPNVSEADLALALQNVIAPKNFEASYAIGLQGCLSVLVPAHPTLELPAQFSVLPFETFGAYMKLSESKEARAHRLWLLNPLKDLADPELAAIKDKKIISKTSFLKPINGSVSFDDAKVVDLNWPYSFPIGASIMTNPWGGGEEHWQNNPVAARVRLRQPGLSDEAWLKSVTQYLISTSNNDSFVNHVLHVGADYVLEFIFLTGKNDAKIQLEQLDATMEHHGWTSWLKTFLTPTSAEGLAKTAGGVQLQFPIKREATPVELDRDSESLRSSVREFPPNRSKGTKN